MLATRSQARPPDLQRESQLETLDTVSTAVLPPSYTVTLASAAPIDDHDKAVYYQKGQECLHDAVRRVRDKEGDLRDLVRARKRRRIDDGLEGQKLDREVLWYTASLRYPCSCDLAPLRNAFTVRVPPPAADELSSLPDFTDASERVRLGAELEEWDAGGAGYADLEPGTSELKEFELGWQSSSGSLWRQSQGHGRFCDAFDTEEAEMSFEAVKESLSTRKKRKGKGKAIDQSFTLAPVHVSVITTDLPPVRPTAKQAPIDPAEIAKMEWEEESRRRKQLWRGLIGKDPGYGQFWDQLARPHSYPNIGAVPDQKRPPDYNLFRNYRTSSHPFHPDLHHYAKKNPYGRVYWLVPIHGPVVVPTLNDQPPSTAAKGNEVPYPSAGVFTTKLPVKVAPKPDRSAPVCWSPALLDHFVRSFLLPLRQSRLYALSLTFSGPKPDPFIALPAPPPLASHAHLPRSKSAHIGSPTLPVRPEAGDHLRIYCDAQEALSLRTWLNGIAIDPKSAGSGDAHGESKPYRLFEKVRLSLVGERGEVLIVT